MSTGVGAPGDGMVDQPEPIRPWSPPVGHVVSPGRPRSRGRRSGPRARLLLRQGWLVPPPGSALSCRGEDGVGGVLLIARE
jgi:hypothetical protein